MPGEVAVVKRETCHEDKDSPERNLMQNVGYAQTSKRDQLQKGCSRTEYLVYLRQPNGNKTSFRFDCIEFLLARKSCAFAAGASGESFNRHGKELPYGEKREYA